MNLLTTKITRAFLAVVLCSLTLTTVYGLTNTPSPAFVESKVPIANNSLWNGSAQVGLSLTRGNTKTFMVNGELKAEKKWNRNDLVLGTGGYYGSSDGERNAETAHGEAQFNHTLTERYYDYLRAELFRDAIADVQYRLTVSPGLGYYVIKNTNTTLRVGFGPGFVYERMSDETRDYAMVRLADKLEQRINAQAKFWENAEILPQVDKFENYIFTCEVGLEVSISKTLSLRNLVQDSYYSQPAHNRQKNDVKLVSAIAYKF